MRAIPQSQIERAVIRDEVACMRKPYMAKGLDQQGRYPIAAEAATEVGVDDDPLSPAIGIVVWVGVTLAAWAAVVLVILSF